MAGEKKSYGALVKAEGLHKWLVCFDFDGKSKVVTSRSLKFVPNDAGIPWNEENERSNSTTVLATPNVDTHVNETYFVSLWSNCANSLFMFILLFY